MAIILLTTSKNQQQMYFTAYLETVSYKELYTQLQGFVDKRKSIRTRFPGLDMYPNHYLSPTTRIAPKILLNV